MHVFAELAAKHGNVDPEDDEAVTAFFEEGINGLPESVRVSIFEDLLDRDGEPAKPMKPRTYPKDAPVPKFMDNLKKT